MLIMRKKYKSLIIAAAALFLCTILIVAVNLIFKSEPAKKNVLFVGVIPQNKPYSWYNHKKKLVGFNVELAKKIAQRNDMRTKFITGSREQLYSKFKHGKIQLLFLNKNPTTLNKDSYYKTNTYLYQPNLLLTVSNHKISNLDTLANRKVAISAHLDVPLTLQGKHIRFVQYSQPQKMLHDVLAKKVRAAVMSDYTYSSVLQKEPLFVNELSRNNPFPPIISQKIFGIMPVNKALLHKINASLNQFEQDGTLASLSQKFFKQDWSKQ
ncbi:hypothetical protein FC19_GL000977 [Liquorilactobacillus aquaticus DSM 21051]|uniref:Solute-binding protein family 3/N-terminal domain-containing protein n=2 Tax=Liquorilactobacillus aquaticus TaxID=392566 RepID=A0A0R2CWM5_9LACO|nr:hypothetical protein FC19_GL000977 [Liquorilactobacillus aquaticus DSM 21051]